MLISIIVPVYNAENRISRCINSIVNQSYKNIEIILINDGSNDSSGQICDEFAKIDKRIKVIHKQNGGVSSARNEGLRSANGEYIQFVDSDDYIDKDMCEKLLKTMINDNSDLVVSGYRTINSNNIDETIYKREIYRKLYEMECDFSYLYTSCFFNSLWNKLYKIEAIENFDENLSLGEDLIFNLNYLKKCESVSLIEECLYNYTKENKNSLSSKYRENMFEIIVYTRSSINEFCDKYISKNIDKCTINSFFMRNVFGAIQLLIYNSSLNKSDKISIINQWIGDINVKKSCTNSELEKLEHRLINYLILKNKAYIIYYYFVIRRSIHKRLR